MGCRVRGETRQAAKATPRLEECQDRRSSAISAAMLRNQSPSVDSSGVELAAVDADPATARINESEPPAGFVKLAMRNMVRKGRQSLVHLGLTAMGLTGFLVLIAWLGRPHLPQ